MTRTLLSSVAAAGLLALLATSPAGAQTPDPHAGHAAAKPAPAAAPAATPATAAVAAEAETATPQACPGMAAMDPAAMAAMHARMAAMQERMAAMTPAQREAMHARMAAMDPTARAAMHAEMMGAAGACPAMAGMDHSAMRAMTDVALKASSPADGATVHGSPSAITLTLPHPMTVESLTLTHAAGHDVPLALTLSESPVESVSVPVAGLAAGLYHVAWRAAGTDHTMSGGFSFTVQ